MKLRIRSLESKETLRIEVPIPCSLRQLKQIISQTFTISSSSSSSPTPPPGSISLSLNRRDEIQSSSPNEEDETLQSLGVTAGDLIFYTINPDAFSSQSLIPNPQEPASKNPKIDLSSDPKLRSQPEPSSMGSQIPQINSNPELNLLVEPSRRVELEEDMEIDAYYDDADDDGPGLEAVGKSFSAPGFLRKVFREELGGCDEDGGNHKLLVIAVHAVLLESGFVGFDMNSKTEIKGFQFRNNWPSNVCMLSLFYTLPGVIGSVLPSSECPKGVVVLKFQSIGKFLNFYGSLKCGSATHLVRLNEDDLVPFLNVAWANCGLGDEISNIDGISSTTPGREVFNFWRTVKDKLALPLLIDLCEQAGLELPPCFMRLPTEIKLKILESLPGVDVAKVSCMSSELRYLASNDDLWREKFVEQFGEGKAGERGSWKQKFVRSWENQYRRKRASRIAFGRVMFHPRRIINPIPRLPHYPSIIGGDYDLGPQIQPFGNVGLPNARYRMRNHMPRCNLGGLGNLDNA